MRSFQFKKLWLLSEREQKARVIPLKPHANAMVGTNHTGKSTISRSLFTAFGCSTRPLGGEWDKDAVIAVEFDIEGRIYTILRRGEVYTLFDSQRNLLWATSGAGELRDKLGWLFGFSLSLTASGSNDIRQARPAFFFAPFFVDQDGSWDSSWRTFQKLGEFQQWERPTLDLALGIRPPAYWQASNELAAKNRELDDLIREQKILEIARTKLAARFPRAPWYRDAIAFRHELKSLESQAGRLAIEQDAILSRAAEAAAVRDSLQAQVRLLDSALSAHTADMVFLDGYEVGNDILCPTCGTPHEHSFHERLNLEAEADDLRQLRMNLKARVAAAEREQECVAAHLAELDAQARCVDEILSKERGKLKLREIIERAGVENALSAFDTQREQLDFAHGKIGREIEEIKERLTALDDPKRAKEIRAYFNGRYADFATQLDVPTSLRTRKGEIKIKPQQGGSGGPRAVLAYYYALAHTAAKYSPALIPALVIDSPHQKAQDEINRPMVTEFIFRNRVPGQQLIVGIEEALPKTIQITDDDSETRLAAKYGLLMSEQYRTAFSELSDLIAASAEFIRENQQASEQPG